MKKICVLGSLNIDLTVTVPYMHAPGETLTASSYATFTGGKGGNQAVALGKLRADVGMAGLIGKDSNGQLYLDTLKNNGISDFGVLAHDALPTGIALIEVDAAGENRIIVVSGANGAVDRDFIDQLMPQLLAYDIFLFQLEIPLDTVNYAAAKLKAAGKTIVLDPAPAQALPADLLSQVDYVTPNETEMQILTGMPTKTPEQQEAAAIELRRQGAGCVIAKLGAKGAMIYRDTAIFVPGFKVNAVDTTAAGDSFNAGFAYGLASEWPLEEAVRFANAVGAIATTALGAQAAMPTFEQAWQLVQG